MGSVYHGVCSSPSFYLEDIMEVLRSIVTDVSALFRAALFRTYSPTCATWCLRAASYPADKFTSTRQVCAGHSQVFFSVSIENNQSVRPKLQDVKSSCSDRLDLRSGLIPHAYAYISSLSKEKQVSPKWQLYRRAQKPHSI